MPGRLQGFPSGLQGPGPQTAAAAASAGGDAACWHCRGRTTCGAGTVGNPTALYQQHYITLHNITEHYAGRFPDNLRGGHPGLIYVARLLGSDRTTPLVSPCFQQVILNHPSTSGLPLFLVHLAYMPLTAPSEASHPPSHPQYQDFPHVNRCISKLVTKVRWLQEENMAYAIYACNAGGGLCFFVAGKSSVEKSAPSISDGSRARLG